MTPQTPADRRGIHVPDQFVHVGVIHPPVTILGFDLEGDAPAVILDEVLDLDKIRLDQSFAAFEPWFPRSTVYSTPPISQMPTTSGHRSTLDNTVGLALFAVVLAKVASVIVSS